MVKVDLRGKEEIVAAMLARAKSYTPEWNMSVENPDIASVLALVCADMIAGTIKKVNGTPLKNEIAFFNLINATLLPASPSEGYVCFSLPADDIGSTEVPRRTVLTCYSVEGDTLHYETCDDVLVSPARIECIFCADDSEDYVGEYEDFLTKRTDLFDISPKNLQSHVLNLSHPYAFDLRGDSQVRLCFFQKGNIKVKTDFLRALADEEAAEIRYYAGEEQGYVSFSHIRESGGTLLLTKDADKPPVTQDEENPALKITVKKVSRFEGFSFSYAQALPSARTVEPDCVTDGNVEYDISAFFPFGERFGIFNVVYFGCGEALNKRGARITMSFDLSMLEVPIENQLPDDGINYKWIATKGDFKEATPYRISITGVIWEYFNGYGWSRLFGDKSYGDLFNYVQGVNESFKSITFICPEDMSEIFVGARSDFYIRARILSAENLYKLKGWYMTPFIRNISFDYYYEDKGCRLNDITSYNCIEEKRYDPLDPSTYEGFVPFYTAGAKNRTLYLGFSAPPDNGPMRILWDVTEDTKASVPKLDWSYIGERGLRHLNMADETDSFTKVGLTVFLDNHGFKKTSLFGRELYWVTITDSDNSYKTGVCAYPMIKSISFNSVRAINVNSHAEEYFAMNVYSEEMIFSLAAQNILDFELYVNETSSLTDDEAAELEKQDRLIKITDNTGMVTEIWVKWQEALSFINKGHNSRCYLLDRSSGLFAFGDGRKGKIPSPSDTANIRVVYTTGGGERTNVRVGAISNLERSVGFISGVMNPKRFYGGCDTETVFDAMKRCAVDLRTQGKAITVRDMESLTFNASRNILKIRCFTGRNAYGDRERGAVTLVVLKKQHAEFSRIKDDILDYLKDRIPGNIVSANSLYITEPTFIVMNVRTEIIAKEINGIFDLKRDVEKCLEDYINSFSGGIGDNNWSLGRIPNEQQLRSAILRLKNVVYIKNIYITTYVLGTGGLKEVDEEGIRRYFYILPENGNHDISVTLA